MSWGSIKTLCTFLGGGRAAKKLHVNKYTTQLRTWQQTTLITKPFKKKMKPKWVNKITSKQKGEEDRPNQRNDNDNKIINNSLTLFKLATLKITNQTKTTHKTKTFQNQNQKQLTHEILTLKKRTRRKQKQRIEK